MKNLLRVTLLISVLGCGFAIRLRAADVSFYGILKQKAFNQITNTAPALAATGGFGFQTFVDASGPDLITDATITIPGGSQRVLVADGSSSFSYEQQFDSASALNASYGTGTYTLQVDSANDIISVAQMTMPADAYPVAPFLTNYVAAQSINPSNAFTLYWSAFSGGTVNDFIQITVRDSDNDAVFRSGQTPGALDALDGTATSILLPANTLNPGEVYSLEILFAKIVVSDTTSIPGARGVLGFMSRTATTLKTTGTPPQLLLKPLGFVSGQFQFNLTTVPGKNYQVQFSPNLIGWTNIGFLTATSSETLFIDSSFGDFKRFYRAYRVANGGN